MQVIRPETTGAGPRSTDLTSPIRYFAQNMAEKTAAPADILTARAVTQVEDSDELTPAGQAMVDLKALIKNLSEAETPDEIKEAMEALQAFVAENTNAELIGGAVGELADMLAQVMEVIEKDPSALGSNFSFDFNADFSQQTFQSGDYQQNITSFSFSFNLQTDNTMMTGGMTFDEEYSFDGTTLTYESTEQVTVAMITFNADLETNPILDSFLKLTEKLTGVDMSGMFEKPEVEEEPYADGAYRKTSYYELLQIQYMQTAASVEMTEKLIDKLKEFFEEAQNLPPKTPLEAMEQQMEQAAA